MSGRNDHEDYLDRFGRLVPWHRPLTFNERLLIVFLVGTFVSIVGCLLLCLVYSRFRLRRRLTSFHPSAEWCMKESLVLSGPPSYEFAVHTADANSVKQFNGRRSLKSSRQSSYGTTSESDGAQANTDGKSCRTRSVRSSVSNSDAVSAMVPSYPPAPYARIDLQVNSDPKNNLLTIRVINGEHVSSHPAFDQQAEFFVHVQLLPNKTLHRFLDARDKHRTNLPVQLWKSQQEKTTKKLSRTADDTLICDEQLVFQLPKDAAASSSLRCLLVCVDRTGAQDLLSESIVHMSPSIIDQHQQVVEFKHAPRITFAEIYLGLSYLPTAERLTIKINDLRCLFKTSASDKIDARLTATFFHGGRRFFQKKVTAPLRNGSVSANNNLNEIPDTITQNIPQHDITAIHVHFELSFHLQQSSAQSILPCGTLLLGERTFYESNWQTMLEQPRQSHLAWYRFFG